MGNTSDKKEKKNILKVLLHSVASLLSFVLLIPLIYGLALLSSSGKVKGKYEVTETKKAADVELYEVRNGLFYFNGTLFGQSYFEVNQYIRSLGCEFAWENEGEWIYADGENVTANRLDIDSDHLLGFYFQNHRLIGVIYEEKGYNIISDPVIKEVNHEFGNYLLYDKDEDGRSDEIVTRYGKNDEMVGDTEGGCFAIFLNEYDETHHRDQMYMSDLYTGTSLNPNFKYLEVD